jgi:antitoxin HicB
MEISEEDGGWFVSIPDLPGCDSFGTTVEDAIKNVQEAKELWMKSQSDNGGEIPEPTNEDDFSGRFVLRIPRTLHHSLAYQAQKQGVSLNHYASYLLAERHPLYALQRSLERRFAPWHEAQNVWVHRHDTPKRNYLLVGARYAGDISAITLFSKPAPKGAMRVPQTLEEQYQLNYAHDR